ncbi:MAG: hypothetical protein ABIV63_09620 [Caldimonas sp.]
MPASSHGVREAGLADVDAIAALDQAASGLGRRPLLHHFLARSGSRAFLTRDGSGFAIVREGRSATQVGPLAASNVEAATALLGAALQATAASAAVYVDVPARCIELAEALRRLRFSVQRPFVRMALDVPPPPCSDRSYALAGPEFG